MKSRFRPRETKFGTCAFFWFFNTLRLRDNENILYEKEIDLIKRFNQFTFY